MIKVKDMEIIENLRSGIINLKVVSMYFMLVSCVFIRVIVDIIVL